MTRPAGADAAPDATGGGYPERMLAVLTLGTIVGSAGRVAVPALLPTIIVTYGISPSAAGLVITALVGGIALFQFVGGRLSDYTSRKTVLVGAICLLIPGYGLLVLAPDYPAFLVGAAVVGIAQGLYIPAVFALLAGLFRTRRGRAFGINSAAFTFGSAIGPGLAVAALAVGFWQGAFLPVIALLCVVLYLIHRWGREPYVIGTAPLDVRATAVRLVRHAPVRRSLLAFAIVGFVWQGGVNFVPTLLQLERGFPPTLANAVFAGLFVVGTLVTPVAGNLGDRYGYPAVATVGLVVGLVGLGLLVAAPARALQIIGVLVFGLGVSSFWPVMDAYVMGELPEATVGGDFGALNAVNLAAGSMGPIYVGLVAERLGYGAAFAGFAVPVLGGLLVLHRLRLADGA